MKKTQVNKKQNKTLRDKKPFILLFEYRPFAPIDAEGLCYKNKKNLKPGRQRVDASKLAHDHVDLAKKLGLCNGFRIWTDATPESIRHAMDGGYAVHIDMFRLEPWKPLAADQGKSLRQFSDEMVDHIRGLIKDHGENIWVNMFAEVDNDPWCYVPDVATRAEAFTMLKEFFTTSNRLAVFPAREDPSPSGKPVLSPYNYMQERGIRPKDLNLAHLCCQPFSTHILYKLGSRAVWPEGNVGNNHQIIIAFTRGAARQYRRPWIYDVAPFDTHGRPGMPMAYDHRRRRIAGFSESHMLRSWMVSYLSGPREFLFQASSAGFFVRNENNELELTSIGEIGRDFADFCLRRHPGRGKTRTPIALLLAQDHGYKTPYRGQSQVFWGKVPDDRANRSIEAFFRLAFPGFHKMNSTSCLDNAAWAPGGSYSKQQPWMTPDTKDPITFGRAFREALRDASFDQRPTEKPYLTASTWGDSFDVLVDNAPLEVLKDYPAIVLLGNIKVDNNLRQRLRNYVEAGGKVMLNIAQVTPDDEQWLGVTFEGETGCQPRHTHSLLTGRQFAEGRFEYAKIRPNTGVKVLIQTGFLGVKGDPLLTRHKLGKGEVWFVTVPDYLPTPEKLEVTWTEASKEAIDEFIRPHLVLDIDGPPLEWIVNDVDNNGSLWVSLFNNSSTVWAGKVIIRDKLGKVVCRDIWNEKHALFEYDEQDQVVLKPEIAPWEFTVIEIT